MTSFNPTPRQVFQSSDQRIKKHAVLISRPEFRDGLETAMLEYQRRLMTVLGHALEPEAASTAWKMAGAQEFVAVFLGLSEIPSSSTRTDPDNLTQT